MDGRLFINQKTYMSLKEARMPSLKDKLEQQAEQERLNQIEKTIKVEKVSKKKLGKAKK